MNALLTTEPPVNTTSSAVPEPLDILLADIRAQRQMFRREQQISAGIVERFKAAGVYRALVARQFGGDEVSPAEFLRLIERISIADGSAGWVASFGVSALYLAALPMATLQDIYANGPDVAFAGALFPPQKAPLIDDEFEVSGLWKFGSGATGADLIGVGIKAEADGPGLPRMAVMPAERVMIERNWDVIGLCGTGSHDLRVDKVRVPTDWTFLRGGAPSIDAPLYRYPSMALAAQVLAVVGLGVGRAALDDITRIAGGHASITGAPTLADRAYMQIGVAKAEAELRSARAFFYEITEEVFELIKAGNALSIEKTNLLRLASSHAARAGANAAQAAFTLSGTIGIFETNPLSQYLQDALVVAQHAFLSEGTWQSAGRILLGLDSVPGFP